MKSDRESGGASSRFASVNPYWETFLDELGLDMTGARGDGCYIEAADGHVLLDCLAGFGTANLGHAHATLSARFTDALQRTSLNVFPFECAEAQLALADRLLSLSSRRFQKVFFATTGAEAVESAVKFAMTSTGRSDVVAFRDSFHGLSMFASFMTGNPFWTEALPWKPGNVNHVDAGNFAALEDMLASRKIAAVVFEPVAGSSAAQHWTAETSARLAGLCRSAGTKLIADEVYCGLGRAGAWFGIDAIGMRDVAQAAPDMIVVSKGLTGGLVPLSAVLMNDGDFDAVFGAPGKAKVQGSTFGGNRLAMQCGLIVLDLVESGRLVDNSAAMGALIERRIADRFDGRLTLHGKGLALSLTPGAQWDINMADVWLALIDAGVLAMPNAASPRSSGSLRLSPPLIFGVDEVEFLMDRLDEALQE
ncbi:aspartate aminotransferase family protein [Paraburkholderia diazotrophica]|uniref:Acetylornithine aminotransferase/ornithine--oxo-acid transaminase n=1 Tax=Paraburkholderia diazotrophica TaxID=667676 RepID=A0A1H7E7P7_9BURK|nr:aminotransferase class III-fold pyridoxal phosphate-dependent enzyme [Paraburkholderia diazotrophica]SEK07680.1 acetylornithine aminotransferase/ornithine--oxo-acid transaminase [Paraburkholderia diazotrophica]